jgi:predicted O-methyltransferase YrrM
MSNYQPSLELLAKARSDVDMEPHLLHLRHLASHVNSILEFGVRGGVSTWALLDGLPADGTYLGIDIDDRIFRWIPQQVQQDPRFHVVIADDREVAFPLLHYDLVMIDSSHEYEHTKQELNIAARLTPDLIVMHDYLYAEPSCKVKQAVDEWVQNGSYRMDHIYFSKWGLLVLVPK